MSFEEMLRKKQIELRMGVTQFSKYLGMNGKWYINFRNPNRPPTELREQTMYKINQIIGIPIDVMTEYNSRVHAYYAGERDTWEA